MSEKSPRTFVLFISILSAMVKDILRYLVFPIMKGSGVLKARGSKQQYSLQWRIYGGG